MLLRAGFDVPIDNGKVTDTTRIESLLPTMQFILKQDAILILMSHQGRPKDAPDPAFSQEPLVPVLEKLLGCTVHFAKDCVGPTAKEAVKKAKPGEVVLLENLRFHPEEKKNDMTFAKELASLGDIYVNDAFTNCHRVHASMVGIATLLPSAMGLQLEEEIQHLEKIIHDTQHPLTLIIGGAKLETKVPIIENFLKLGDDVLLGGAVANTFIAARGFNVGASKYDKEAIDKAQGFMLESTKEGNARIHVPHDSVVASDPSQKADRIGLPVEDIEGDMAIFDIGPISAKRFCEVIEKSAMIIWNGPVGLYEVPHFAHATKIIAEAVGNATKRGALTIIGGGDTIDFHQRYHLPLSAYSFVSMGGGAMLEFLSGKPFPSLQALEENKASKA